MGYDVVIVGGGIAGLTAAAYLSSSGYKVLLCEKEKQVGGLVNSFCHEGFTFDGGIRAIENSGVVLPMLRQLGIEVDWVKNHVSIGIERDIVRIVSDDSLLDYQGMLVKHFPQNEEDIARIIQDIRRVMGYMDVMYGIDNPLFLDMTKDRKYLIDTLLPWLFRYALTIGKIQKLNTPIVEYLSTITPNQSLIDMIAQHFFQNTPASFALSYFTLYLDYQYPRGGTGALVSGLEQYVTDHHGEIRRETEICRLAPGAHWVMDTRGNRFAYKKLIWAADLKTLYNVADIESVKDNQVRLRMEKRKGILLDKTGGDSVLSLYVTLDLDPSYFDKICTAHVFYTPNKQGLSRLDLEKLKREGEGEVTFGSDKQAIMDWTTQFLNLTTYEISIPVLRDGTLAPEGKTGLIISTLFDYSLVNHVARMGWYDEFKELCADTIITRLDAGIFAGIEAKVMGRSLSTPLTLKTRTGNSEGAITGWAFTNSPMPAVNRLTKISRSVLTPIPDVLQAGQWTYSPSGLPISVLTGKLAAEKVRKTLRQ